MEVHVLKRTDQRAKFDKEAAEDKKNKTKANDAESAEPKIGTWPRRARSWTQGFR